MERRFGKPVELPVFDGAAQGELHVPAALKGGQLVIADKVGAGFARVIAGSQQVLKLFEAGNLLRHAHDSHRCLEPEGNIAAFPVLLKTVKDFLRQGRRRGSGVHDQHGKFLLPAAEHILSPAELRQPGRKLHEQLFHLAAAEELGVHVHICNAHEDHAVALVCLHETAVCVRKGHTVQRSRDKVDMSAAFLQQDHQHQEGQRLGKQLHQQIRPHRLNHDTERGHHDDRSDGDAVGAGDRLVIAEEEVKPQRDIECADAVQHWHHRAAVVDPGVVHIERKAGIAVGQDQKLGQDIGQDEQNVKQAAAPDAGAVDVHDVQREADRERSMEEKVQGVEQILPEADIRKRYLRQPDPADGRRRGEEIAQQQKQEDEMLVLQFAEEAAAHPILPPFHRKRIDQADKRQDKRGAFKIDCIHP